MKMSGAEQNETDDADVQPQILSPEEEARRRRGRPATKSTASGNAEDGSEPRRSTLRPSRLLSRSFVRNPDRRKRNTSIMRGSFFGYVPGLEGAEARSSLVQSMPQDSSGPAESPITTTAKPLSPKSAGPRALSPMPTIMQETVPSSSAPVEHTDGTPPSGASGGKQKRRPSIFGTKTQVVDTREDKFAQLGNIKTADLCRTKFAELCFEFEAEIAPITDEEKNPDGMLPTRGAADGREFVAYREQGDNEMDRRRTLLQRRSIARKDPYVERMLRKFYDCFDPRDKNKDGMVRKEAVLESNVKFVKALYPPEEFSEREAMAVVEEDWVREMEESNVRTDRVARNRMSREEYIESVREIVDTWTVGVTVDEYRLFLSKLYKRVTVGIDDGKKKRRKKGAPPPRRAQWRPLQDVVSVCAHGGAFAEEEEEELLLLEESDEDATDSSDDESESTMNTSGIESEATGAKAPNRNDVKSFEGQGDASADGSPAPGRGGSVELSDNGAEAVEARVVGNSGVHTAVEGTSAASSASSANINAQGTSAIPLTDALATLNNGPELGADDARSDSDTLQRGTANEARHVRNNLRYRRNHRDVHADTESQAHVHHSVLGGPNTTTGTASLGGVSQGGTATQDDTVVPDMAIATGRSDATMQLLEQVSRAPPGTSDAHLLHSVDGALNDDEDAQHARRIARENLVKAADEADEALRRDPLNHALKATSDKAEQALQSWDWVEQCRRIKVRLRRLKRQRSCGELDAEDAAAMRALEAETAAAKEAEVVDSRAIAMLEARVAAGDVNEASLELRELRRQRQRRRGMLAAAFSADVHVERLKAGLGRRGAAESTAGAVGVSVGLGVDAFGSTRGKTSAPVVALSPFSDREAMEIKAKEEQLATLREQRRQLHCRAARAVMKYRAQPVSVYGHADAMLQQARAAGKGTTPVQRRQVQLPAVTSFAARHADNRKRAVTASSERATARSVLTRSRLVALDQSLSPSKTQLVSSMLSSIPAGMVPKSSPGLTVTVARPRTTGQGASPASSRRVPWARSRLASVPDTSRPNDMVRQVSVVPQYPPDNRGGLPPMSSPDMPSNDDKEVEAQGKGLLVHWGANARRTSLPSWKQVNVTARGRSPASPAGGALTEVAEVNERTASSVRFEVEDTAGLGAGIAVSASDFGGRGRRSYLHIAEREY